MRRTDDALGVGEVDDHVNSRGVEAVELLLVGDAVAVPGLVDVDQGDQRDLPVRPEALGDRLAHAAGASDDDDAFHGFTLPFRLLAAQPPR